MKYSTIVLLVMLFFIGCESKTTSEAREKIEYEKSKKSIEETEKESPVNFLTVVGDRKKNLIGQTVVRGTIVNKAKIVTYKDVDMKLTFYSKTGAVLEEDIETVYENVGPNQSINFKSKFFTPKGTDSISFKILKAKY